MQFFRRGNSSPSSDFGPTPSPRGVLSYDGGEISGRYSIDPEAQLQMMSAGQASYSQTSLSAVRMPGGTGGAFSMGNSDNMRSRVSLAFAGLRSHRLKELRTSMDEDRSGGGWSTAARSAFGTSNGGMSAYTGVPTDLRAPLHGGAGPSIDAGPPSIPALVARACGNDAYARAAALYTLCALCERGGCRDVVRSSSENVLGALAQLMLRKDEAGTGIKAAHLVASLATGSSANQQELTRAGAVAGAITLLESGGGNAVVHEAALRATSALLCGAETPDGLLPASQHLPAFLHFLAPGTDPRLSEHALWIIAQCCQGNPSAQNTILQDLTRLQDLARLLQSGPGSDVTAAAASVVGGLADGNPIAQDMLREAGALDALVGLLYQDDWESGTLQRAVWALVEMVAANEGNQEGVRLLRGIEPLVSLLDGHPDSISTFGAVGALCNLGAGCVENQLAMCSAGVVEKLVRIQKLGMEWGSMVVEVVSWTLQHLATASREVQDAVREAGAFPLLVRLLDGPFDSGTTEKSVWALCNLAADNPDNREAIREEGGVSRLVGLLDAGPDSFVAAGAAWTLLQLAVESPANQQAIRLVGGIPPLVALLGSEHELVLEGAAGALLNLASGNPENQEALREAEAAPALLAIAREAPHQMFAVNAVGALRNMAANNIACQNTIQAAGAIPTLLNLLCGGPETQVADVAAEALLNLVSGNPRNREAVWEAGGVADLVHLLEGGPWMNITERAVWVLCELMTDCPSNQDEVREVGGINLLIGLLKAGPNHPITPHAARALQAVLRRSRLSQVALLEAGGCEALVRLLDGGPVSAGAGAGAWALMELCHRNPEGQAALLAAGGVEKLVALLDRGAHLPVATAAAWALAAAAARAHPVRDAAVDAGGVPRLTAALAAAPDPATAEGTAEGMLRALGALCDGLPRAQTEIADAGGIPLVVAHLKPGFTGEAGSAARAERAASTLRAAMLDCLPNQDAAREAGAIPRLLALLDTEKSLGSSQTLAAARSLYALVRHHHLNQDLVREAGGIPKLVALISAGAEGSSLAGECGASTLLILCHENAANKDAAREAGGIKALVLVLVVGLAQIKPGERASMGVEAAAGALCNLTHESPANSAALVQEGGLLPLVGLLGIAQPPNLADRAAKTLQMVARHYRPSQDLMRQVGAVPPLVRLLGCGPEDPRTLAATWALLVLAFDCPANREAIREAGAIPALIALLSAGPQKAATEGATTALLNLCHRCPGNQDAVREAGGLPPLVALLNAGPRRAVTERVAACLRNLAMRNPKNQEAIREAGGLDALVHLLGDPNSPGRLRQRAGWALHNMAQGNEENARRIRELGGVMLLIGIAALGVTRHVTQKRLLTLLPLIIAVLAVVWRWVS